MSGSGQAYSEPPTPQTALLAEARMKGWMENSVTKEKDLSGISSAHCPQWEGSSFKSFLQALFATGVVLPLTSA